MTLIVCCWVRARVCVCEGERVTYVCSSGTYLLNPIRFNSIEKILVHFLSSSSCCRYRPPIHSTTYWWSRFKNIIRTQDSYFMFIFHLEMITIFYSYFHKTKSGFTVWQNLNFFLLILHFKIVNAQDTTFYKLQNANSHLCSPYLPTQNTNSYRKYI